MRVGVPKEIKNHECRVGLTSASVRELARGGGDPPAGRRRQPNVVEPVEQKYRDLTAHADAPMRAQSERIIQACCAIAEDFDRPATELLVELD